MKAPKGVVYIVEDDSSFRKSVERLIRSSGYHVVPFGSASAFLAQESIQHPACLLLDVQLPDLDGLRLQEKINQQATHLPIIFMTGHGTIPMSVQAMKRGAIDFLPKPFESVDLLSALGRAIERNKSDIQAELQRRKIGVLVETLTPRENEILRWMITGKLNKQIAYELGITEKTVKVHRSRLMQKLNVSSVAELVRLAEKVSISPAE
jgi:RNA polymerase sigma factor (sigma-70 family)